MTEAMPDRRAVRNTLLDAIPGASFVLTPTLVVAAVNDAFADVLGSDRTALVGAGLSRVIPEGAAAAIEARFSGGDPAPLETRLRTAGGDTVPVAIRFSHVSPATVGLEPPMAAAQPRSSTVGDEDRDWLLGTLRNASGPRVVPGEADEVPAPPGRSEDDARRRSIRWTVGESETDPGAERILKVLHDPRCRRILGAVGGPPMPAKEIADVCDLPRSTTYRKLNLLREADLVDERIEFEGCGRHATTYVRNFRRVSIVVTDDGDFRLDIAARE